MINTAFFDDRNGNAVVRLSPEQNRRLIMNTNNHEDSARSDIETNGNIQYNAGSKDHGWMSVTDRTFIAFA